MNPRPEWILNNAAMKILLKLRENLLFLTIPWKSLKKSGSLFPSAPVYLWLDSMKRPTLRNLEIVKLQSRPNCSVTCSKLCILSAPNLVESGKQEVHSRLTTVFLSSCSFASQVPDNADTIKTTSPNVGRLYLPRMKRNCFLLYSRQ